MLSSTEEAVMLVFIYAVVCKIYTSLSTRLVKPSISIALSRSNICPSCKGILITEIWYIRREYNFSPNLCASNIAKMVHLNNYKKKKEEEKKSKYKENWAERALSYAIFLLACQKWICVNQCFATEMNYTS